jgi:porphobilinogen deaminase
LHDIRTLEAANKFLNERYIDEFNRRFMVPAAQRGTAFISCRNRNLEMTFTQRYERTVDRDNTVRFNNLVMQLERAHWRDTLAGCKAIIHQHLDTTLTLMISGHRIGHYSAEGKLLTPLSKNQIKAVEKTLRGKVQKQTLPLNLQIPHKTRDSHFSTASTTTNL